jgi:hypothetical protein
MAAVDGPGSHLSQAPRQPCGGCTSRLSVLTQRCGDGQRRSGVERGHDLYPASSGVRLCGGDHGLVQPLRVRVGSLGDFGQQLLPLSLGACLTGDTADDLQYGGSVPNLLKLLSEFALVIPPETMR